MNCNHELILIKIESKNVYATFRFNLQELLNLVVNTSRLIHKKKKNRKKEPNQSGWLT